MQVEDQVGLDGVTQRTDGHLLGFGPVADPVQSIRQPRGEAVVLSRAHRTARHCLAEQLDRNLRCLADQQISGSG